MLKELETQFDKWLYVFRHLSQLQDRPRKLQDKIFKKLFEAAEIAKFTPVERQAYEDSLKYYRDLNNVVNTLRQEGREKGRKEGRKEGKHIRAVEIAKAMKANGEPIEKIIAYTSLTKKQIEDL